MEKVYRCSDLLPEQHSDNLAFENWSIPGPRTIQLK